MDGWRVGAYSPLTVMKHDSCALGLQVGHSEKSIRTVDCHVRVETLERPSATGSAGLKSQAHGDLTLDADRGAS